MATDAEIRAAGFYAVPEQRFLRDPFQLPTKEVVEEETESFGIPQTQAFTNSGGNNYTGGNFNTNNFQRAIDAKSQRIKNPSKIKQFAYDNIPGINKPQTYEDIMTKGYQKPDMGIPLGITSLLSRMGVNTFDQLPQSSQAFITSQRGYKGPTIFGENTGGGNVDPYGLNVDSLFGNYDEAVSKDYDKLGGHLTKSAEKRGLSFDRATGGLVDANGDPIDEKDYDASMKDFAQMNKMNLGKYGFRGNQINKKSDIVSDLGLIDQGRRAGIKNIQNRVDRSENNINKSASKNDAPSGASTVNPSSSYGKSKGYSGGHHNPHTSTGWSGSSKKKDGGRIGYFFGGRVNYKVGGRTDAGANRTTASKVGVGQINESGQKVSGGDYNNNNNNDGGVTKPVFYDKNDNIITTDFISKDPNLTINYTDPKNYASLKSKIGFNNILDNDDITAEGNLTGEFGPVSYNTNFTDKGITGTNLTAGNVSANISPDMQLENLSYSKGPFSISSDGQNTRAGLTFSYKNGGLAGLL